jgi:hypothetical protein
MPDSPDEDGRAAVATEIRRVRDAARDAAPARDPREILPPPRPLAPGTSVPPVDVAPQHAPAPPAPDNTAVNELWSLPSAARGGGLYGLLRRLLGPLVDAQVAFNSRQVQLDNQILEHLDARLAETHRHYDRILGEYGQRLNDADERHRILERELVAHVHDLVKRIDLVLTDSERGRLSLDTTLRDVRARLLQIEERLGR